MAVRTPMQIGSTRWIMTLAAMTAVIALSIDMSLPAQPTLAATFDVEDATAGLTLSVFMIGFAIAQLIVGYLSDAWGRRRVLIGGLALFSLSGIACAFAPTIEVLLVCRVLQAIGGSAAPVVARAMVRDTQPAHQVARILSTMLATLAIAPMLAPTIGTLLLGWFGWRAIFVTLALLGLALMVVAIRTLTETLIVERRQPATPGGLVRGFRTFFATPGTRVPMLISASAFAGQFAYIADSPFVYMQGFGVTDTTFSILFGLTALALILGSLTGRRMLNAGRSPGAMVVTGASILVFGGIAVTIGTSSDAFGIAGFLVPMIIYFFGVGIASPSATAMALEPVPQIAGTASAAIGFLTMTAGALAGYGTTKLGGRDPHAFAKVVAVMAVVAAGLAGIAAWARRKRIRA